MSRHILVASAILLAPSAMAQTPDHPDHASHAPAHDPAGHEGHTPPAATTGHSGHDEAGSQHHGMRSARGDDAMSRDASGTSWRPAAAPHDMLMRHVSDWMLMAHGNIDLVYTSQNGPRGDNKGFVAGMVMGAAQRRFEDGSALQFRAGLSPDPLMGKQGYPLLLAAGETADGVETLVDRQHPHDIFMELSASYSRSLGAGQSVFVYAGLPGEPAFGPPAFMHRPAAEPNPEAPITHHWLDSTHISYGVLTAGYVNGGVKIEASRFRGRESDQDRHDIETGELDSTAVRLSWNPTDNLALQASWADVTSPEQLEPDVDVVKWSASALWTQTFDDKTLSLSAAFARKDNSEGVILDAWLGEAALQLDPDWTLFSRIEAIETDELGLIHHGPIEDVARATIGLSRDFRLSDSLVMAIGASATQNRVSDALSPLYNGNPAGALAFVRFSIM